jgi:hypothetical protein
VFLCDDATLMLLHLVCLPVLDVASPRSSTRASHRTPYSHTTTQEACKGLAPPLHAPGPTKPQQAIWFRRPELTVALAP